jgi:hypothetical protein
VIRAALTELAKERRQEGAISESECYIDPTFAPAKGSRDEIGSPKRGNGVKIMAIVDRHCLPPTVTTYAANHQEATLVQTAFDLNSIKEKPENLIGDRAGDSDKLNPNKHDQSNRMIAPHRANRVRKSCLILPEQLCDRFEPIYMELTSITCAR